MSLKYFRKIEYKIHLSINKMRLKNKTPSIISSNCNGGIILHDLGLKFNTPTINLYYTAKDFLKFVKRLDYYLAIDLQDITGNNLYPIGKLDDIEIHFLHYNTFTEAKKKWNQRRIRVNKQNLFIMMTDRDGCTLADIMEFDSLPYSNKVIFTHKPYPSIKSAVYIHGFEKCDQVGILSDWKSSFIMRRYLDDFDYVSFLNNNDSSKSLG